MIAINSTSGQRSGQLRSKPCISLFLSLSLDVHLNDPLEMIAYPGHLLFLVFFHRPISPMEGLQGRSTRHV